MKSIIKKFFVAAMVSLLVLGNLSFVFAASLKSPQVIFKIEKEATNDNYKQFAVNGSAKQSTNVTVSATDKEKTMLVKTSKTNSKGEFKLKLNLASLVDGKITVKVIAKNKKGSNAKSQTTVKKIKENVVVVPTPEPPIVVPPITPEPPVIVPPIIAPPVIVPPVTPEPPVIVPPVTPEPSTPIDPVIPPVNPTTPTEPPTTPVDPPQPGGSKIYTLTNDQETKWNISDKGKNAAATTAGLNDAIEWAGENGYTDVKLEDGTYLIAATGDDQSVNMISNMKLLLADNAILQKETNNEQGYAILNFGNVDNAGVKGGKIIGDRETHNYSKPDDGLETNTHEWGSGIATTGSSNITIDDVLIKGTTGDGVGIFATTVSGGDLTDFEKGAIDDNGKPIVKDGKIRTVGRAETNFDNRQVYEEYDNFYTWLPEGMESNKFDVYFYDKANKFISFQKQLENYNGEAKIPKNADYFVAVFDANKTDVKVTRMTVDLSENITIKNSELDNSRRQGVSVVGSRNVNILNNHIHDVRGVAPGSGIDIEPAFYPSDNTIIKGNKLENNFIQIVLAYGNGADISDNTFIDGEETSVGLYAWSEFKNVNVHDNTFDGIGFYNDTPHSKMTGNKFLNGAEAVVAGENQTFTDSAFVDSVLSVGNNKGQTINNVNLKVEKLDKSSLWINENKTDISNLTIDIQKDPNVGRADAISGNGHTESIYEKITITDKTEYQQGSYMPQGTFTNVDFDMGELGYNQAGTYSIKGGTIKADNNLIEAPGVHGSPTITIDGVTFVQRGDSKYGASIHVENAKSFNMTNSSIEATTNSNSIPLVKLDSDVQEVSFKDVTIKTKKGLNIYAIDTVNGGNAPYRFENVKIYNGKLALKANDVKINVELLTD